MTNKITQEIEKRLTRTLIKAVDESKEVWFQMGFKAGQKQSEDAFKEMIEEWWNSDNIDIEELLSKIGDNSEVEK